MAKTEPLLPLPPDSELINPDIYFGKKFTTILVAPCIQDYIGMLYWIDTNSTSQIRAEFLYAVKNQNDSWNILKNQRSWPAGVQLRAFIAFEDDADALIFKIKYL